MMALLCVASTVLAGVPDTSFVQEYAEAYPIADVRAVAVDGAGAVWIAAKEGARTLRDGQWQAIPGMGEGAAFDVYVDGEGSAWIGAWDGLYRVEHGAAEKVAEVGGAATVVGPAKDGVIALSPDGAWRSDGRGWSAVEQKWSRNLRDALTDDEGNLWVATGMGLYREGPSGFRHYYREEEICSGIVDALALGPKGRLWAGCWGGIDAFEHGMRVARLTAEEGLPNYDVRALAVARDGTLWVGTALGVARYNTEPAWVRQNNGSEWSLRHSRRWLLSDDVRDVAIGPDGTAWVATDKGVSAIKRRDMTLAEKARHYQEILEKRHVRAPYLVEKCFFPTPGDFSVWEQPDDDNDGQYTNMYMAMESFRYAVTKDPKAKENADRAFDAMEFLQTVTGTDGFIARTVVPGDDTSVHDGNQEITPEMSVERRARDPRYKQVEVRWRPSADGKWLWKGDTSSDEVTGHFFGYMVYHELAADDAHKERLRKLVARVMDYIIDGGYTFIDPIDGKHTRWGVWSPEKLKGDPDWRVEGRINAFEILSYLRTAHHITGDGKYEREYLRLLEKEGYRELVRRPKAYGISERTHIDDELMALAAPGLFWTEQDPERRALFMEGYAWAYQTVKGDQDPYFDFTYYLMGGRDVPIAAAVAFLRDQPLDLRYWAIDNSQRDDIELVRRPMQEPLQTNRMLPPSERGVMRWDKNPWPATNSGDSANAEGQYESAGVFWLLPYWMGRYAGVIGE